VAGEGGIWILKDALSNGAEAVWIINAKNWRLVTARAQSLVASVDSTEWVVQRYVDRPLLWQGRFKYHYRCYGILFGDMRFFLYRKAFAHVANKPWVELCTEKQPAVFPNDVHITNVAANVTDGAAFHGFPVVDLVAEAPQHWEEAAALMKSLISAVAGYMGEQRSRDHFCLMGLDLLPAVGGGVELLEINIPPCLGSQQSSLQDGQEEAQPTDCLLQPMMQDLVRLAVLPPLRGV
jgi:hypothetical protein